MGSKSSSQPLYLPTVQSSNQSQSGSSSGTSTTSPDPLAALAYQQVLANAAQIAQTPFQPYEGQMIAGFTPDQIAAMEGIRQSQGIQNPYLQQSGSLYNQLTNTWQNPAMGQVQNLYGTSLNYIPNQYMPAVQNYANTAANASANPLLGTAQRYGQQAAISSLNPYMGTAQGYLGESVDISDIDRFNQGALSRYMSPYQQSVIDATLAQMKQNQDVLQNQNTANAIRQGAYGGSGQFMGQAELGRQQALSNAQTLAGLNQANYQQAMGQYNQQQQQAIQALQQAASTSGQLGQQQAALTAGTLSNVGQMLGQLGQQQSNLQAQTGLNLAQLYGDLGNQLAQRGIQSYQNAAQNLGQLGQQQQALGVQALGNAAQGIGNLGEQAQKANLTDLQALLSTGQLQQQLGQQQLTNAYNQWLQARAYPYQQTSYFGGLAGGLGPLLGQTGTTSTTSQSTSSGSGTGISPYQQQQSGGGNIPGLITAGLGILSSLKDGGVVKERKPFADGGDAEEDESFGDLIAKTPYSGSDLESPVTSKAGLGSLMSKQPYDAPSDYIGEASKLQKVIKPAASAARENVLGQINKLIDEIPTMKKFDMDMPEGNMPKFSKFGSGSSEGDDWGGVLKSAGKLAKSEKFQNFASEGLGNLSSMFADGGEVNAAVSEYPQHQYSQAQRAQNQANLILSNYQNQFGKAPSQGGFESLVNQTRGMRPEQITEAVKNFAGNAPATSGSMSNYDRLLQQAYARNPGPQLTPEQQGMPRMPSQQYYSQKYPSYEGATSGNLNLAKSMPLPEKYVEPTAEGASPFANFVNGIFQNYLGRRPTQDEMNWNLDVIKKGTKPADLENSIRNSSEATNTKFILDQYKDVLGHSATLDDLKYWKDQMAQGVSAKDVGILMRNHPDVLNLPEAFRGTAPVQGYFSELANTQFNPYTGLFNFKYKSPYRGTTVGDFLTKKDGGAVGKAGGGSLSGKSLYDYLISLGANAKEASMLTGMAKAESAFDPYAMHDEGSGFGLWGHGRDRWADMQRFTGQHKPGWEEQAKFALWELRNSPKTALARQTLNKAQDARDVAIAGMHFERPAGYRPSTPWAGKNWQQRYSNVASLMGGKDIGAGSVLPRINPKDPSGPLLDSPAGVAVAEAPRRPGFIPRLLQALAPISSAAAAENQPSAKAEEKPMFAWPTLRNPRMNNLPDALGWNQQQATLPEWKKEVQTGFGPLQGEKPADEAQLLAEPSRHTAMGPEAPEEKVVAEDRAAGKKSGKKYWGDWRDAEPWASDPIGGLFDTLSGEEKRADAPGKYEASRGFDLGELLGFADGGAVRNYYADGGASEDDNPLSELGSLIESGLGGLGDTLGGLFGEGQEAAAPSGVVAEDRPSYRIPRQEGPSPISQALLAAGLGMLAAPTRNPLQAVGMGGLRGFQVYSEAAEAQRKREEIAAQQAAQEAAAEKYQRAISGEPPVASDEAAPSTEEAPQLAGREPSETAPSATGEAAPEIVDIENDPEIRRLSQHLSHVAAIPAPKGMESVKNSQISNLKFQIEERRRQLESRVKAQEKAQLAAQNTPEAKARAKQLEAEQEALAKEGVGVEQEAKLAEQRIATLNRMKDAVSSGKFRTGALAEKELALKKAVQSVFPDMVDEEAIAMAEQFDKDALRAVTDATGGKLGAGVSDADVRFLTRQQAGLGTTKAGNVRTLDAAIKIEKRKQDIAQFARDYKAAHNGVLDSGYYPALQQWAEAHPMFSEEKGVRAEDTTGAAGKTVARVGKSKSTGKKIIEYTDGTREYAE